MTTTTLRLSDLAPGDVAVFVYPDGCEGDPFAVEEYHGVTMVRTENQRTSFDAEGGLHPVRRLGRGRLEPARIEMQGEPAGADLAEQAMMLREALAGLLGIINDSDQRKHPSTMRMMNIVSGKSEFVAVDAARAALAATAPTPTEGAK